ncbi:hypothetical protein [uncultured Alistipes sp.]|uniref:hypothetical protein n=1 Tax=uncultured Alistipes sp. TaxID=538949 RepID=UPI00262166B5|nr:hypothetical protein [uncultured Alistipes sp.]
MHTKFAFFKKTKIRKIRQYRKPHPEDFPVHTRKEGRSRLRGAFRPTPERAKTEKSSRNIARPATKYGEFRLTLPSCAAKTGETARFSTPNGRSRKNILLT